MRIAPRLTDASRLVDMYPVLVYSVRLRHGEIGLRMALGSSRQQGGRLMVRDGLTLAAVGITLGLAGAVVAARVIGAMLFGVTPFDLLTYGMAVAVFSGVAVLAYLIPASRAARVPPVIALRGE